MQIKYLLMLVPTLAMLSWLAGCASTSQIQTSVAVHPVAASEWTVLPLINNTTTPYAGRRAQSQLAALLNAHGVTHVVLPPPSNAQNLLPIGEGRSTQTKNMDWARQHQIRYVLTGSADEWRYKIGLNGQPAVGFTLRLVDLRSGKVIWSGSAAASGSSREGLAVLSQQVLDSLVARMLD